MTSFTISDNELDAIKDQVVVVTGASSGIGLGTLRRLISHGAKVYATDINPLPEPENSQVPFTKADVTSWKEQLEMFKAAKEKFGQIDHVFANAGIGPTVTLLEDEVDENGDLLPPKLNTINVNLIGCMYTVKLGIYYIRQNPNGGSIVMTGSGSSFARFPPTDYTTAKHGILGMLRSLYCNLHPTIPIRINAVAPYWTDTAMISPQLLAAIGPDALQSPDVVARSAIILMADKSRHGELIWSEKGKFLDMENGENGYNAYTKKMLAMENAEVDESEKSRKIKEVLGGKGEKV